MEKNEVEKKIMGDVLSYQKTLEKLIGPLNEMSPIAKEIEQQVKATRSLSERNLSVSKSSVTHLEKTNKIPMLVNKELYLAKETEKQINELKDAILNLHSELQLERQEREKNEHEKVIQNYSLQELQVLCYCPDFFRDYQKLIQHGYMRKVKDGYLEWLKSKQSLAEYFGTKEKRGKWADIENLFRQKKLGHLLSVVNRESKDFKKLKQLLKN